VIPLSLSFLASKVVWWVTYDFKGGPLGTAFSILFFIIILTF